MLKLYDFKSDVSGKTDEKHDCIRMTHLTQSKNRLKHKKRKEHHYYKKTLNVYAHLIKLDKVLSSDRVYSIHAILWYKKSLCLELVFVFSLNSAIKSLLYPIVILQKNKKEETMTGQRIAYIRVSASDQNTESQRELLKPHKIDRYFEEKVSGKNASDRLELQNMLAYVREGDTVYVKDLSRLARNTKDLLDIVEKLTNKGVSLFSIKESIDTSTNMGKLMLTLLGAIYEFERVNLLERQRDGIALAKKKGKYKGRKKVPKPDNFSEIYKKWHNREITSIGAIRQLGISEYAFYKFVREENANG